MKNKRLLLLAAIFCFSFLYRAAVIFHNAYPPSSDIGLHGSIINLILDQGTLPTWNPYHMGGEQLATPPGFHFFVSIVILFTQMPVVLAELITAAFYSSIIVFPAYSVAKRMWKNPNAGIIAAFFASISALSIEMISWGGYTNIVSLSLIVIIFYLFLRDNDKPSRLHLVIGSLLFGALIITHTFSLSVVLPIVAVYLVFLIIGKLGKLKEMKIPNMLRFFTVSAAAGILLVSPWILRVFDFYIGASTQGALTGGLDNKNLILANRTVEPILLTLLVVVIPAVLMLKTSRKSYFDRSSLLLMAWFVVPVVMTQAYIFGIYTDYSRFMYFIEFPGIIIISAGLLYLCRYTTIGINMLPKIRWNKIKKILPTIVFTAATFIFITASLWSIYPHEAMQRANYYTTIQQPEDTAIKWITNNTPEGSVLVADHLYGWWLSGIAQRPTLSAAGLEFLIYSHELEVAKNAQLLLDTNYYIDNGYIQVRDDGPYLSRHNPEFSIETWSGESFALMYFQNNETIIEYNQQTINLTEMQVTQNTILQNEDSTTLTTTYENEQFTVTKTLQVQQAVRFAELSYQIQSSQTSKFDVQFTLHTTADQNITIDQSAYSIGAYNSYQKINGQVFFTQGYPLIQQQENTTNCAEIIYNTQNSSINIEMIVTIFDPEDLNNPNESTSRYGERALSPLQKAEAKPITTWNYMDMIEDYDVAYVVCRDQDVYMKFAQDPNFRLVFNCKNVAVFQVTK
ncbi:MAG: hypothetical protein NWF06_07220 [Candidatus Bathyarchaeota archaeon]|nr:hypothetical protein [Candidatus Bathyarchaeum sp.]